MLHRGILEHIQIHAEDFLGTRENVGIVQGHLTERSLGGQDDVTPLRFPDANGLRVQGFRGIPKVCRMMALLGYLGSYATYCWGSGCSKSKSEIWFDMLFLNLCMHIRT